MPALFHYEWEAGQGPGFLRGGGSGGALTLLAPPREGSVVTQASSSCDHLRPISCAWGLSHAYGLCSGQERCLPGLGTRLGLCTALMGWTWGSSPHHV